MLMNAWYRNTIVMKMQIVRILSDLGIVLVITVTWGMEQVVLILMNVHRTFTIVRKPHLIVMIQMVLLIARV